MSRFGNYGTRWEWLDAIPAAISRAQLASSEHALRVAEALGERIESEARAQPFDDDEEPFAAAARKAIASRLEQDRLRQRYETQKGAAAAKANSFDGQLEKRLQRLLAMRTDWRARVAALYGRIEKPDRQSAQDELDAGWKWSFEMRRQEDRTHEERAQLNEVEELLRELEELLREAKAKARASR